MPAKAYQTGRTDEDVSVQSDGLLTPVVAGDSAAGGPIEPSDAAARMLLQRAMKHRPLVCQHNHGRPIRRPTAASDAV